MMKTSKELALSILASSLLKLAASTPTPNGATDSAITILRQNDLYGPETAYTSSALLIESPKSWNQAGPICASFGETIWSPETQDFFAGINSTLSYQIYLDKFAKDQLFWINTSSTTSESCQAIDVKGKLHTESCHSRLPVLCTNSGQISNYTSLNNSARWQVTQRVGNAALTGYRDWNIFRFMGIRYAQQPERFTYSTLYEASGPVSAIEPGSECVQPGGAGSEDCLFLNVWTPYLPGPHTRKKDLKPVMMWIHGGGLLEDSGSDAGTDANGLASRGDIVAVNINFRLGSFGWLGLNTGGANGNYGLGDMITAANWVKNNIADLGGDPDRITIWGESGGAAGVRALLASEKTKDLFAATIMESIPLGFGIPNQMYNNYFTVAQSAATYGAQVVDSVGCTNATDVLACMRAVPASAIANSPVYINYPLIDDNYLTAPLGVTGKSYAARIPTMMGVNRDEMAVIDGLVEWGETNQTVFLQTMGAIVPGIDLTYLPATGLFPLYPPDNLTLAVFNSSSRIVSDNAVICLTWATAYSLAKHHIVPSLYTFQFNRTYMGPGFDFSLCDPPKTPQHPLGDPENGEYFKCHTGELGYVFGVLPYLAGIAPDRDGYDYPFMQFAVDTWSQFAWNTDPNPNVGYLKARGYWGTLERVQSTSEWGKATSNNMEPVRVLQRNSHNVGYTDGPQCGAMGYPIDYYEKLYH